jgi:competence protein ComEC
MGQRGEARAGTWPGIGGMRRAAAQWPFLTSGLSGRAAAQLRQWATTDTAPGRLIPWLAIAFAVGIATYFSASREPAWWAACGLAAFLIVLTFLVRGRPIAFPAMLALTVAAIGFAVPTLKSLKVAHPVLAFPAYDVTIKGFVEVREERERSDRVVVKVHDIQAARLNEQLERVRVSVRRGTAPPVGSFIELKARLTPPLGPLRPGGYDFARDMYFNGIGASGFVLGRVKTLEAPQPLTWRLRYAATLQGIRDSMDARIRSLIPGDAGAIASALITGKRDAISAPVNEAMYVSSLAHVLSISGYHMAVVAGVVFFVLRGGLALVPGLAARRPIKKWAALAALIAAFLYLLLSGSEVATQRSFIMIAIVLIGVMLDRQALTLRTLTIAAFVVLAIQPEALVHPSFQMSFAATLALVAAYERGLPWMIAGADTSFGARVALWGGREILALIFASLIAGLATMPYAAFHFHRYAPYGVLANLLAMPIVSLWVMPAGILAVLALPFGLDAELWKLMGLGIDWMIAVALWVAKLPGALGRVQAFGTGPLIAGTFGLVLICLLRSRLRWTGAAVIALATFVALRTPQPDVLIAPDAQALAVRGADGRLAILRQGRDSFAIREWLAADADPRVAADKTLGEGTRCDAIGCMAKLPDGRLVAHARDIEAFEEDCAKAAVVVSPLPAPNACAALLIDRDAARRNGALTLRMDGTGFRATEAYPPGYDRPWAKARPAPAVASAVTAPEETVTTTQPSTSSRGSSSSSRSQTTPRQPARPAALDATPPADLGPDD